jgi:hypothetical protein
VRYPLQQATNNMPEPLGGGGTAYYLVQAGGGGGYGTKGECQRAVKTGQGWADENRPL